MAEVTEILTEEKKTQLERHDEIRVMKSEIEAYLRQIMQEKMNELELKVDNKMDQLTKDLDGIKANLHAQTERLNNCEMQLKEGVSDMKTMPMLEEMRGEFEKMKLEQTRVALKAKEDSEMMYTVKGRADAFIQLLEQKDERMMKELNEHKTNMMDEYKNHLKEVKTTMASVDTDWEEPRALDQMETKIFDMMKDHHEWLGIMKQLRKDERRREMGQTNLNRTELIPKAEKMEAQMQKYGDELRVMENQMTTINKQMETFDNRVTDLESKLTVFDYKVTILGNEVATIDSRVTADDNEITTINNNLVTIEKKAIATDNRMTTTDKEVESIDKRITTTVKKLKATDNQIADIDKKVSATINRLTWMENWQKKLQNIGIFGTLRQKDGCQVSEFTFTVKNIEEEITKANQHHHIESEPFYTNIMGYRAKLRVYPNNHNTNHVGVYLIVVEGEFDDIVSWPFNCKYGFHCVGRDGTQIISVSVDPCSSTDSEEALGRPQSNKSNGYGIGKYIKSDELLANKDQYIIDGGFSIKITIWLSN